MSQKSDPGAQTDPAQEAIHQGPPGAEGAAAAEAPAPGDRPGAEEPPEPDDAEVSAGALGEAALRSVLESLLFVAERPLAAERLKELTGERDGARVLDALAALERQYLDAGRGIQLHQIAGGYQLRTAPENAPFVQKLLQQKPIRLSRAQLETLAIVAYRQPITRPEIDDIRGVDSGGSLKLLLDRDVIRILGKKEEPGRPLLYGTTKGFLEFFNLRDLRDLPTLREYYELSEEHQARVDSMSSALEDIAPRETVEPPRPPPLGRVELKDLNLGDDEDQMHQIDEMIRAVRTDVTIEGLTSPGGAGPATPAKGPAATPEAPEATVEDDEDREPEEL